MKLIVCWCRLNGSEPVQLNQIWTFSLTEKSWWRAAKPSKISKCSLIKWAAVAKSSGQKSSCSEYKLSMIRPRSESATWNCRAISSKEVESFSAQLIIFVPSLSRLILDSSAQPKDRLLTFWLEYFWDYYYILYKNYNYYTKIITKILSLGSSLFDRFFGGYWISHICIAVKHINNFCDYYAD